MRRLLILLASLCLAACTGEPAAAPNETSAVADQPSETVAAQPLTGRYLSLRPAKGALTRAERDDSLEVFGARLDGLSRDWRARWTPDGTLRISLFDDTQIERIREVVAERGALGFHRVPEAWRLMTETALASDPVSVPEKLRLVYFDDGPDGQMLIVSKPFLRGDAIDTVGSGFDQRTGEPSIEFSLDADGTQIFAEVSEVAIGQPIAMVVDDRVLSAPIIREPIRGGRAEINTDTIEEAVALARILSSGALPAPLDIVEEGVFTTDPETGETILTPDGAE